MARVNAIKKKEKLSGIAKNYERDRKKHAHTHTRREEERERERSSRHTLFMSSRVPCSQCGSTKSKCIAYANAGRAPVVSVGVNSQSASGNNHNDQ